MIIFWSINMLLNQASRQLTPADGDEATVIKLASAERHYSQPRREIVEAIRAHNAECQVCTRGKTNDESN